MKRHPVPLALLAVVGLTLAGCSGLPTSSALPTRPPASGTPPSSASPTPAGGNFVSTRFGWSLELPSGFAYRAATTDWPPHTYPLPGATYTDNFERPGGFPVIDVSTQVLPADQTPDQFLLALDEGSASIGCSVDETGEIMVDGQPARLQRQTCASGLENAWEVVAFDGERVYLIYWIGLVPERAAEEPVFREVIASFRFAPD